MRDEYCRLLASTKAAFYSREIESASNDNRAMFGIANHLLGRKCGSVLPHDSGGPTAVANRFAHHFVNKLSLIRSQIQSTPAGGDNTQACITPSFLLSFQPATLSDVMALINSGKTKSSKIDPSLFKANTAALAPFFVNLINMSYTCCTVPARLKHAVVTPLLKRPGLPTDNFPNHRPISNLPYASKLLERHVSAQLRLHLQNNNIEDPFQSAYRPSHSVETAIVCIQDDVLRSLDARKTLHLFYLTSALRLIRLITASFSRNYTESACVVTHFAGCRPTSPTEHSASVLTITYLVRYGCNTELPRAACWAPYSSLYTVLACRKCS